MFERFTNRARHVVVLAQQEARHLRHDYIGTEHILLGLVGEGEGLAGCALKSLDITADRVRTQVLRVVGSGQEASPGQIPFTPRAKKVLELALRESLVLGHNYIGTEHILLGLAREEEGAATRILLDCGVDAEMIRGEVIRRLSGPEAGRGTATIVSGGLTDPSWLGELHPLLEPLADEIRDVLGRTPDSGDLLLALGCARRTVAGRALAELGVDLDGLSGLVERVRTELWDASAELERQAERFRQAKEAAIEAQNFEEAGRLRDQERRFAVQRRELRDAGPEALEEIRRRLGLPGPPGGDRAH